MDKQETFEKVILLADEIEQLQLTMEKNREDCEEIAEQLKLHILEKQTEIAEKEDDKGKKLYSNEMKRQAAFREWAEHDARYITMTQATKELRKTNHALSLRLEYKRNTIRAYEIYSRL